jgi:D-sedoheptulose 7-phosphate isomerase
VILGLAGIKAIAFFSVTCQIQKLQSFSIIHHYLVHTDLCLRIRYDERSLAILDRKKNGHRLFKKLLQIKISMDTLFQKTFKESIIIRDEMLKDAAVSASLDQLAQQCIACLNTGGKILFCGNGGSAADAQHLAAELSGRFAYDRPPLASEALHVNTSFLTAVANDYSYEEAYARMVRAIGKKGDVLIALSTSGNSMNIVKALEAAKSIGFTTAGFTGASGGRMTAFCDLLLKVPSSVTPRIQEVHITIGHILCQAIESALYPKP